MRHFQKPEHLRSAFKASLAISVFVFSIAKLAAAQTYTTLLRFDGANGGTPTAPLVQGFDENLYGASEFAGSHGGTNFGGTVFNISPGGALTTVYNFCVGGSGHCTDGYNPVALLARDSSGNFYGTATSGGANGPFQAYGTVFKITSSDTFTTLHNFCTLDGCTDGTNPNGGVILASNGNLYGTTVSGGAKSSGTVFKITTSGALTTLHSFCSLSNCTDGAQPSAGLIQASDGNFYGSTSTGGLNSKGTVFKITSAGMLTTLYSFCSQSSCTDGAEPLAKLLQGADGNLYGTTTAGGKFNKGTIFKISTAGKLTILYSFCGISGCADGETPMGALMQATDGNFYGTTFLGGAKGFGTIFRLKPPNTLTTLYSFCSTTGCPDGANPIAGLMQDTNGELYGTAMDGGSTAFSCDGAGNGGTAAGCGTVFSFSVGLHPFVSLLNTSGKVGAKVAIVGDGFSSSSVAKFNGLTATSTLTKPGMLMATVPPGATNGYVTVTTGSTTLTSTQKFTVHNSWARGAPMPVPAWASATGVVNGKVYVIGGLNSTGVVANNQIYNTANNTWTTGTAIPTPVNAAASAVVNGLIYVIGGYTASAATNEVQIYNPKTNTWSPGAAMPTPRGSAAAVVDGSSIYVIGGNGSTLRLGNVEKYLPATNTWTEEAPLRVGKSEPSAGLLGSTIVVADGYTTSEDTGDNEAYNVSTNNWSALASDSTPRNASCFGAISGQLYNAGGGDDGAPLSLTESFNATSNTWITLLAIPQSTIFAAGAVANGQLYCFGGSNVDHGSGTVYPNVQIYQP